MRAKGNLKSSEDSGRRNRGERGAAPDDLNVRGGRRPHGGIGGAEEQEARHAARRSEVADAGIVAEEVAAAVEDGDEVFEGKVDREGDGGGAEAVRGEAGGQAR